MSQWATAIRDGFNVPLIGIPVRDGMEDCDCCGRDFKWREVELVGTQFLCAKCKDRDLSAPIRSEG